MSIINVLSKKKIPLALNTKLNQWPRLTYDLLVMRNPWAELSRNIWVKNITHLCKKTIFFENILFSLSKYMWITNLNAILTFKGKVDCRQCILKHVTFWKKFSCKICNKNSKYSVTYLFLFQVRYYVIIRKK